MIAEVHLGQCHGLGDLIASQIIQAEWRKSGLNVADAITKRLARLALGHARELFGMEQAAPEGALIIPLHK